MIRGVMHKIHVALTTQQKESLRELAEAEGCSVSHLVREGVATLLRAKPYRSREEIRRRALSAVGRCPSGLKDLARNHDRYLWR